MPLLNRAKCCDAPPGAGCCHSGGTICEPGLTTAQCNALGGIPVTSCLDCVEDPEICPRSGDDVFACPPPNNLDCCETGPNECPPGQPGGIFASCQFTGTLVVPDFDVGCDIHPPAGLSCSIPGNMSGRMNRTGGSPCGSGTTCRYDVGCFSDVPISIVGGNCPATPNPNCPPSGGGGAPLLEVLCCCGTGITALCLCVTPFDGPCSSLPPASCWTASATIHYDIPCGNLCSPSVFARFRAPRSAGQNCPTGAWLPWSISFNSNWFPGGVTVSPLFIG